MRYMYITLTLIWYNWHRYGYNWSSGISSYIYMCNSCGVIAWCKWFNVNCFPSTLQPKSVRNWFPKSRFGANKTVAGKLQLACVRIPSPCAPCCSGLFRCCRGDGMFRPRCAECRTRVRHRRMRSEVPGSWDSSASRLCAIAGLTTLPGKWSLTFVFHVATHSFHAS